MKKIILGLAVTAAVVSFSSCKKGCMECKKGGYTDYVCRDHHPNAQSYNAALKLLKANGYSCKKQ